MSRVRRRNTNRVIEQVFDVLGLAIAWHSTVHVRVLLNSHMRLQLTPDDLYRLAPPLSGVILLWFGVQLWLAATRPKQETKIGDSFATVFESAIIASTLTIVLTFFSRQFGAGPSRSYVLLFAPVSFTVLVLTRYLALLLIAALEGRWLTPERVAVVGRGAEARQLADDVRNSGARNVTVEGVILPENCLPDGFAHPVPVLGTTRRLAEVINRTRLDRIIIVKGAVPDQEADRCGAISHRMGVVLSQTLAQADMKVRLEFASLGGVQLLDVRPIEFTRRQAAAKRIFDLLAAAALLILLAPLYLLISVLVKLTSKGPVLYRSSRVGLGGRYFTFLKFRSMYHNQARPSTNEKCGHIYKVKNDPRITPMGRMLRKYSLDELPQLWNVIRGDMSLVGPRPLPSEDLDPDGQSRQFRFWSEQRSRALPGITGLWQVSGRSDASFEQMIDLDVEYMRRWSLGLDFRILLETPLVVLTGRGAY